MIKKAVKTEKKPYANGNVKTAGKPVGKAGVNSVKKKKDPL